MLPGPDSPAIRPRGYRVLLGLFAALLLTPVFAKEVAVGGTGVALNLPDEFAVGEPAGPRVLIEYFNPARDIYLQAFDYRQSASAPEMVKAFEQVLRQRWPDMRREVQQWVDIAGQTALYRRYSVIDQGEAVELLELYFWKPPGNVVIQAVATPQRRAEALAILQSLRAVPVAAAAASPRDVRSCGPVQETVLAPDVVTTRPSIGEFPDPARGARLPELNHMGTRFVPYRMPGDTYVMQTYKTLNRVEYLDSQRYQDKDRKEHGPSLYFDQDSGLIERVYEFEHGKGQGYWRIWNRKGQLLSLIRKEADKEVYSLVWRERDATTYLQRQSFSDNGTAVGKTFHDNGRLQRLVVKHPDGLEQILECASSGVPELSGQRRFNIDVGEWLWFNSEGKPRYRRVFDDQGKVIKEQPL